MEQLGKCTKDPRHRKKNILHVCAEQTQPTADKDIKICTYPLDDKSQLSVTMKSSNVNTEDAKTNNHAEICKLILQHKDHKNWHLPEGKSLSEQLLYAPDNEGNTPLHLACEQGNLLVCKELITGMTEVRPGLGYLEVVDFKDRTPLHECALLGNTALLQILLPSRLDKSTAKQILSRVRDSDGKTPLHLACAEGKLEMVQRLIEGFDVSINTRAKKRDTPFFSACEGGHLDVVNYLLKQSDIDTTARNSKGLNALDTAIINHQEPVVRRLLECKNWRRLMENAHYGEGDDYDVPSTPMRELIIFMPDIAYEVIENKLTKVIGGENQAVHQATYDYSFFDDQYSIRDWTYGENQDLKRKGKVVHRAFARVRRFFEGEEYMNDDK
ncbi:unnamed protein product, partial [Adineta steineri]